LFIPTLWQRRLYDPAVASIAEIRPHQLEIPGQAFSAGNLLTHIPKNIFVLTGLDPNLGFTPVLFCLSVAGIYILARKKLTDPKALSPTIQHILPFGIATFILMAGILSSYHWGDFQLHFSNRFAMVFLPYMVFCAVFCLDFVEKKIQKPLTIFLTVFLVFHLLFYWPVGAHQKILKTLPLPREYHQVLNYLKTEYKNPENTLIICERPNLYVIHQYGAVSFPYANSHMNEIMIAMSRYYDHIVVIQSCGQKEKDIAESSRLHDAYRLQEKRKINVSMQTYIRISELIKT
jgi:hypothetical protein